jgi:cysteinyl-tRNA synthetase
VFADLLKRTLRWFGYPVRHVINITDVGHLTSDADEGEDKIERASREARIPALEVAERWTQLFQRDLLRLNVDPPDVWAKATGHIREQIEMIRKLEEKGFTYRLDDGIYFDTSRDSNYGKLSGLQASEERARVQSAAQKRNPADFGLWKLSPAEGPRRQLEWPSPWGTGFPGWHIECSAMATQYLGTQFEIHTGGVDHIAVHHTNEIAQSENALGVHPWVKYWMHGGWLLLEGEKVSKSKGHTLNLDDLEAAGIAPGAYRYYLLQAHYRQSVAFNMDALRGAQSALGRLAALASSESQAESVDLSQIDTDSRFRAALADDLNAPEAIATLWDITREPSLSQPARAALLTELGGVLGLDFAAARALQAPEQDPEIDAILEEREQARKCKDFARADAIRKQLSERGITIEDTPKGPRWHRT